MRFQMRSRLALPVVLVGFLQGSVSAQCLGEKLVASDAAFEWRFGWSLGLSGDWALVGAPGADSVAGDLTGAVYVLQRNGPSWTEVQKLVGSDIAYGDAFGDSLAVDGTWSVMGALAHDALGVQTSGAAYVFENRGAGWVQTQKLTSSPPKQGATFGNAVAIKGTQLVVGARSDFTAGYAAGRAFVYELVGGTWVQTAVLVAGDAEPGANFGESVVIDQDVVVVGAIGEDNGAAWQADYGAAYVFEKVGGSWGQTQKLVASNPAPGDRFGHQLALEGNTLLVGVPLKNIFDSLSGAVYVFERQSGSWTEIQMLVAPDQKEDHLFGDSVQLQGAVALIGATGDDDNGTESNMGSAYVFEKLGPSWIFTQKLLAPDGQTGDTLGFALTFQGSEALLAAPHDDDACPSFPTCWSGSVYAFELAQGSIQYCFCPTQGPCSNHDDFGGCTSSGGAGAVLSACGSASVAQDDLVLETRWLPENVLGIVFMGGGTTSAPFGDGRLCVAPGTQGVYRFVPPLSSGAGGVMTLGPGIAAQAQQANPPGGWILEGQTWHFQTWYRDPTGPCGSSFNLSNALRVSFGP